MTKLITSDVDRYLTICGLLDDKIGYAIICSSLSISRSIVSQVVKHRKESPEFEVNQRKKINDQRLRAMAALKKKESTKPVPKSTKTVLKSTNPVPNFIIDVDGFFTWVLKQNPNLYHGVRRAVLIRSQNHKRMGLQRGTLGLYGLYLLEKWTEHDVHGDKL